ncbi:hypothetical protein ACFWG0_27635 [Streptomyces yangpuensis]|uniref:hypothetical protein n=1 Tax=Streptomyces yangpuensis TaxID=1648182 RepID=UPI0036536635
MITLSATALFTLVAIGLGIWFKKDKSFRKREFIAVSVFWILVAATPWGATAVAKVQDVIGNGAKTASETVNSVSSK